MEIIKNRFEKINIIQIATLLLSVCFLLVFPIIGFKMFLQTKPKIIISQINKLNQATNHFIDRFGKLPGDYNMATENLGVMALNGDGNGAIYERKGFPTHEPTTIKAIASGETNEYAPFFQHLHLANLLDDELDGNQDSIVPGRNFPKVKFSNAGFMAYTGTDMVNYWHLGIYSGEIENKNVFTPAEAHLIDAKLDDGMPNTGAVMARGGEKGLDNLATVSLTKSACMRGESQDNINNQYQKDHIHNSCQLKIRME